MRQKQVWAVLYPQPLDSDSIQPSDRATDETIASGAGGGGQGEAGGGGGGGAKGGVKGGVAGEGGEEAGEGLEGLVDVALDPDDAAPAPRRGVAFGGVSVNVDNVEIVDEHPTASTAFGASNRQAPERSSTESQGDLMDSLTRNDSLMLSTEYKKPVGPRAMRGTEENFWSRGWCRLECLSAICPKRFR